MAKGRVLVTGGAGFIGSHIVDELLTQGYEPYVADDLSSGRRENLPPDVPLFEVDIRDADRLAKVFAEVKPQFVSHQAAQISVSRSVREPAVDAEINVVGLLRVLELSAKTGVERVVFASSGGVLYGDVFEPATEEHPAQPVSPYGISKWVGERYLEFFAKEHGLSGVALRYANVYGPRQDPHGEAGVVAIFAKRMLTGLPVTIFGDGRNVRDYVYVADVARGNVLAVKKTMEQPFVALNIGTGMGTDVNRLELLMRNLVETTPGGIDSARRAPPPRHTPPRPGDLRSSIVSHEQAQRILGWEPRVILEQGLQQTVQWFAGQAHVDRTAG